MKKDSCPQAPLPLKGLLNLLAVYIVWSSTYMAIRIAVVEDAGFPPFIMGASRMVVAGLLLLAFAYFTKQRIKLTGYEWKVTIITGILLWNAGNGMIMWAEQQAHSGFAALMASGSPIWVTFMESVIQRRLPSRQLTLSLLVGFIGLGILSFPALSKGASSDILANLIMMGAAVTWAIGSVYQTRNPVTLSTTALSGYQHLIASIGFLLLSFLFGEPAAHPTPNAWMAWGYLIIFGSIIGYTAFMYCLRTLPLPIAMTYSYVNPVLALLLGWFLLNEPITYWTIGGATFVLAGVWGIFHSRFQKPTEPCPAEAAATST